MSDFRLAVKAFIVKDGAILLLKRRLNDVHKGAEWDIPGGRLNPGESPFLGLAREIKEETGLEAEIIRPLAVQHFTRDDGQIITMIIFLCRPQTETIALSEEHTEYQWLKLDSDPALFPNWLRSICADLAPSEVQPNSVKLLHRATVAKPWGKFEQFTLNEISSVKVHTANPQAALSLQFHHQRDEFWRILSGAGQVVIGDETKPAKAGDEFFIPRGAKHRITTADSAIEWLEISFGEFDENDIVRLADKYNRK